MKKLVIVLMMLLCLVGCNRQPLYPQPEGRTSDMSGYGGLVSEKFVDIDLDGIFALFEQQKTAIIYFGYASCPWCNALVPVLNEVSMEKQMKLYYLDWHADINYQNEKIFEIVDICDEAGLVEEHNSDGTGVFYFPTILYLEKGVPVLLHSGTVSGHDGSQGGLSEKQRARLKYMLEKEFDSLILQ